MEQFSEEHSKLVLSKEWLVKTDNQKSTPYLFKFYSSTVDISCCILLTDTKSAWAEVLTGKQFARRWHDCNRLAPACTEAGEEDAWRATNLDLLSRVHTLGGIAELSFEIVDSNYADLAFELECDFFKWRWETYFLGHKLSAEIISKHLILPLISVNHMAFSLADAVSELSDADIEKAVDKLGRTARRTVDTHVKHAVSKPRVATTLRRMTAMFNFISELPAVVSTVENPELADLHVSKARSRSKTPIKHRPNSPHPTHGLPAVQVVPSKEDSDALKLPTSLDSSTESEAEESVNKSNVHASADVSNGALEHEDCLSSVVSPHISPLPSASRQPSQQASDSDSSPHRPVKKVKKEVGSSSDDSEDERRRRVTQLKSGSGQVGGIKKRGTRQPLKRGGKRF